MSLELALDLLSWAAITVGSLFAMVGGLGILRLPDFYSRMHAAGITDTLGAGLIVLGLMFQSGLSLATVKLVIILFFLLVTSPTAAHALARSALHHDVEPLLGDTLRAKRREGKETPPSKS